MLRIVCLAFFAAALIVVIMAWGAYRATQQQPDFYAAALKLDPQMQQAAGDDLERAVLELRNEVRREGQWRAAFTDDQINGWLAADMPDKFPRLLPKGASDPRVAIQDDQALIACRYEGKQVSTVVSLALEVQLTEEPNVLAIRVLHARAGTLPLPLAQFLDKIATAARRSEISLRWAQTDGDPVALVTLPSEHIDQRNQQLIVESIELEDGEMIVAGRTVEKELQEQSSEVQLSAQRPPAVDHSTQ